MIISPISYIEEKKNWNLKDLYKEKEELEKYIDDYTHNRLPEQHGEIFISQSPDIVASMYKEYLMKLKLLITRKEKDNKQKMVYKEYTKYEDLINLIKEKNYFFESSILEVYNQDGEAKIKLEYEDVEYWFYFKDVIDFKMELCLDTTFIYDVTLKQENGNFIVDFDEAWINITSKELKIQTIDSEKTIYSYASIKYKEDQDKTFYYISNIDDLKIGNYVWVSVRYEEVPGIVENIEQFSYNNVPFPINRTKTIIRKSTKQEYEQFHNKKKEYINEDEDL